VWLPVLTANGPAEPEHVILPTVPPSIRNVMGLIQH
jgi:hypothetical protein